MTRVHTASGWTNISGPTLTADDASEEFFEAARSDSLLLKWCASCQGWAAPVTDSCPHCYCHDLEWRAGSGRGDLVTWSIVHSSPHPAFADDMPIVSAIVELIEGPWLNLRLLGSHSDLQVGGAVEVGFAHPEDGVSYPIAILPSRDSDVG